MKRHTTCFAQLERGAFMTGMNSRKMKILEAIINDYISTAEPIGSRTIAKKYDFGLSSATIRNEMSDLEEMGYVAAPHASAGRVPSDKGYRLYVDEVVKSKARRLAAHEKEALQEAWGRAEGQALGLVREMARAMAVITNYTIIATEPLENVHKVKLVQVFVVDDPLVALVLITNRNVVRNQVVVLPVAMNSAQAAKVSAMLTAMLAGSSIHDLTDLYISMARHRFVERGLDESFADPLMAAIIAALYSADSSEVYTVGMKNILDFPEFADLEKARAIVGLLEEKEDLLGLLAQNCDTIQIAIGTENENELLKECSIIKARIRINRHCYGNIAIVGPTRMDYAQVFSVLEAILKGIKS